MRGLADQLGTSAETMYEWFRDKRDPSLDHLTRLAAALSTKGQKVTRTEILAAMDSETPYVPLDAATEDLMRRVAEQVLDDRLGRR